MVRRSRVAWPRMATAAFVVVCVSAFGCATDSTQTIETATGAEVRVSDSLMVVEGASSYFFDSTTDLVSFADFIVLATVLNDSVGALPPDGEGLVRRDAEIRVDRVLWAFTEDQVVPEGFELQLEGFWYGDDELHPMELEDAPRLEVGDQFIGAFFEQVDEIVLVTQSSALVVKDGVVVLTEEQRRAPKEAVLLGGTPRRDLHGQTVDEIAESLERSTPQPENRKYEPVPPEHRKSRMDRMRERRENS